MAQIFHVFKLEIPIIIRNYGNYSASQRSQFNYYEVLRISPNATQKEIKNAYIKLSKELHPDAGNKGNHIDFVKINEAYSVLSKPGRRQTYDTNLKFRNMRYNQTSFHQNNYYQQDSYKYGSYRANTQWNPREGYHPDNASESMRYMKMFIIVTGVFIAVDIFIQNKRRIAMIERSKLLEHEYETLKKNASQRTDEEQKQFLQNLSTRFNSTSYEK
ncbi:uncharacterized protein LOC143154657 isoform X2 [Ptiloglossa arizonensis]|uniref:uncharacterized protein LOC143154657 isoform X2 n=1 Tax=Ptiloglossa arizonensis TaxID=3350558 RepID=UPI003F9FE371